MAFRSPITSEMPLRNRTEPFRGRKGERSIENQIGELCEGVMIKGTTKPGFYAIRHVNMRSDINTKY
jgi:hypothetical protein